MSRVSRPLGSPQPAHGRHAQRASDLSSNTGTRTSSSALSSQHSSLSAPRPYRPNAHTSRPLRSRYPRDDAENHVEYILVASFDIDRGSIMEHQYPVAITGDENMLAELMLPDGVHARKQDWTMFFLHKDTSQEEEEADIKADKKRRRQRRRDIAVGLVEPDEEDVHDIEALSDDEDNESIASELEGGEGPPLIYVLNLVNTKMDNTAKRGAVVKAMAICTRHPFLHIYKPLLLLALDEYFKAPHPGTLASLYQSVNNMDLSLIPKLSLLERHLLQSTDNKDLFVEKFEEMIQMRMAADRGEIYHARNGENGLPNGQNSVEPKRIGTRAYVEGHSKYSVPRDTHEYEATVMYNGIPVPIKVPVAISPEIVGDFSLIKLIQLFSETHNKDPKPFPLHAHLTTSGAYTHPIIVLLNALLTQKRIIFLGHNRPSGEVAEAVLAACALASGGILRGFTRHAFPYTDLTKIDALLNVPGFLAGVTNPMFENHPEWWDVLCDLPSGRITISKSIEPAPVTEGLVYFQQQSHYNSVALGVAGNTASSAIDSTGDLAFINDVLKCIAARRGEAVIRAKWRDWILKFTRIAAAFEESVYGASALYIGAEETDRGIDGVSGHGYVWTDEATKQRELFGSASRIEGWRNTRSYYSFIQDIAQLYIFRPLKAIDLHHIHDRLRTQKMSPAASGAIYMMLSKNLNTYDEICQLLCVAPDSQAGLFYLALGLFHSDEAVRLAIVDLLDRVCEHEAGRHWFNGLSRFEKLAYERIRKDASGTASDVM